MPLTREGILASTDLPTEEFDVPEWGGVVLLKALSAGQRQEIEMRCAKSTRNGDPMTLKGLKMLVATYAIVGEDGKQLFADRDIPALEQKSAAVIDRIFDHVLMKNALTKKDVESLAGN
jgi:hypothetical protein